MTFQQLQYLLEVSHTGSVTQAAKNLYVSYSSISISISNLEKELGYTLFDRSKNGLVPTELGEQVLEHAANICRSYEQITRLGQQHRRAVRINCLDTAVYSAAFTKLLEEIRGSEAVGVTMTAYHANDLYQKMQMGELELSVLTILSFAYGFWEQRLKKGGLTREVMRIIPAVIKVGKGHPLYNAKRVYPHDLQGLPVVDKPERPLTATPLFKGIVYTEPSKVLMISSETARQQTIARGLAYGICIMPPVGQPQTDDIRYIPLEGIHYYILAVTNPQYPMPPEAARFLQLLRQELQDAYPTE